uniref:Uncharacterized protein n=1 Tax=Megaselia scalaris TaxID=36166 RepID=T1GNL4_MEGSC
MIAAIENQLQFENLRFNFKSICQMKVSAAQVRNNSSYLKNRSRNQVSSPQSGRTIELLHIYSTLLRENLLRWHASSKVAK